MPYLHRVVVFIIGGNKCLNYFVAIREYVIMFHLNRDKKYNMYQTAKHLDGI